jgi:hypothetical protein
VFCQPLHRLFTCLLITTIAIFQLHVFHHYRWQGCKFKLMFSTSDFYLWGFFYVSHLLQHGTSAYKVSSERPVPTSHSTIPAREGRIIWSSRRRPNRCDTWATVFVCLQPYKQFFSYLAAVTITGDRAENVDLCLALMAFSSEGSFTCHTCCDTVPLLIRSHPKDPQPRPTVGFDPATLGSSDVSLPL